ncbi:MAG TPA: nitrogenase component 1 [Methanoregula sp.]|nr:nitrogenase component 1 [Methanoregula sp.]
MAVRIPRGTCKLFGAIKALNSIKKCVVLVHGPKGCVYHINYIMGMRGDHPSEIYSTCLGEKDVIFGADQKLRTAIGDLDRELHPDLIAVLSCCASDIIGEDVQSAIRGTTTTAPVIGIDAGGFEGDFRTGYSETLTRLVEEFVEKRNETDPRSVNLVGLLRGGPDLQEIVRDLGLITIKVNTVLTADATLEEIRMLGKAALNIVLCEPAGKDAAELLYRKCGTPWITEELPIGVDATRQFLMRVNKALGLEQIPVIPQERFAVDYSSFKDRRIALVSGPTRAISMTRFFIEHGIDPMLIIVDFDSNISEKLRSLALTGCEILIEPEQDLIVQKLKEKKIDLLIGGMMELPVAKALGIEHLDIMHGSQRTIGFAGAKNLIHLLSHGNNGGA